MEKVRARLLAAQCHWIPGLFLIGGFVLFEYTAFKIYESWHWVENPPHCPGWDRTPASATCFELAVKMCKLLPFWRKLLTCCLNKCLKKFRKVACPLQGSRRRRLLQWEAPLDWDCEWGFLFGLSVLSLSVSLCLPHFQGRKMWAILALNVAVACSDPQLRNSSTAHHLWKSWSDRWMAKRLWITK